MSEMVERVARAMCEKAGTDWSDTSASYYAPSLISRPFWTQQARAAIEAMREPTEDMVCRGVAVIWFKGDASNNLTISKLWPVMIDEALK